MMFRLIVFALLLTPLSRPAQDPVEDPFRGTWKPVTLDLEQVTASEAFAAVFKQASCPLREVPGGSGKKFSLHLKGATFWEAVDEICRRDGGLCVDPERGQDFARPWIDVPVWRRGPLRISALDVARVREVVYPDRFDRTELALVLLAARDFLSVPSHSRWRRRTELLRETGQVRLTRAEDDSGKSLLPLLPDSRDYERRGGLSEYNGSAMTTFIFRLQPVARDVRAILNVEGEWEGKFLADLEEIVLDKPGEPFERQIGPIKVTLTRTKEGDSERLSLGLSYDEALASEEWKKSMSSVDLREMLAPIVAARDGKFYGISFYQGGGHQAEFELTEDDWRRSPIEKLPQVPLTIRLAKTLRSAKVPFSLKRIELPKEVE